MENCVDRVGSEKSVTKLDFLKGYWQVPHSSEISTFVTPDHLLQYTVTVLSCVKNCEVYLDEIVAYSDILEHSQKKQKSSVSS